MSLRFCLPLAGLLLALSHSTFAADAAPAACADEACRAAAEQRVAQLEAELDQRRIALRESLDRGRADKVSELNTRLEETRQALEEARAALAESR